MATICYDKLWRSEIHNNVIAKKRAQDINFNQIKLKVNETYRKNEKITTKFEPSNDDDIVSKAYLDTKTSKIEGHISFTGTAFNEIKSVERSNKQSDEGFSIERVVKSILQMFHDKGLIDDYDNADEVPKDYPLCERLRLNLEELNDIISK